MNAPQHHPSEEMLLDYAAGTQPTAVALVMATHLSLCPTCRAHLDAAEAAGGALLEDLDPASVDEDVLSSVLARLDEPAPVEPVAVPGSVLPAPLRAVVGSDLAGARLRWKAPGVRELDLGLSWGGERARLVRLSRGVTIPLHGHTARELTLVLQGGLQDDKGDFERGDLSMGDPDRVHEQHVLGDEACVCLVVNEGPLRPKTLTGRILARIVGI